MFGLRGHDDFSTSSRFRAFVVPPRCIFQARLGGAATSSRWLHRMVRVWAAMANVLQSQVTGRHTNQHKHVTFCPGCFAAPGFLSPDMCATRCQATPAANLFQWLSQEQRKPLNQACNCPDPRRSRDVRPFAWLTHSMEKGRRPNRTMKPFSPLR